MGYIGIFYMMLTLLHNWLISLGQHPGFLTSANSHEDAWTIFVNFLNTLSQIWVNTSTLFRSVFVQGKLILSSLSDYKNIVDTLLILFMLSHVLPFQLAESGAAGRQARRDGVKFLSNEFFGRKQLAEAWEHVD